MDAHPLPGADELNTFLKSQRQRVLGEGVVTVVLGNEAAGTVLTTWKQKILPRPRLSEGAQLEAEYTSYGAGSWDYQLDIVLVQAGCSPRKSAGFLLVPVQRSKLCLDTYCSLWAPTMTSSNHIKYSASSMNSSHLGATR